MPSVSKRRVSPFGSPAISPAIHVTAQLPLACTFLIICAEAMRLEETLR